MIILIMILLMMIIVVIVQMKVMMTIMAIIELNNLIYKIYLGIKLEEEIIFLEGLICLIMDGILI